MKRRIALVGLVAMLLPGLAHANIFEKVGTFGGQFLKISVGARGAGMGDAYVAVADDATAVFWNAAGIARIDPEKSQLSLNHANWPADLSFDQVGYVFHMKKIPGAFSVHARALTMQPMEETTAYQPNGTGQTFDAGMLAAGLTYARSFTDKFSAGLTLNTIHTGLADLSQQTFSVDLGTGVGFHFPVSVAGMADFDYSYTDMMDLGAAHRFSLRFEF